MLKNKMQILFSLCPLWFHDFYWILCRRVMRLSQ